MRLINSWTEAEVVDTFHLDYQVESQQLQKWLEVEAIELSDFEQKSLERIREKAFKYVRNWNETELTAKSVNSIFDVVDFDQMNYSLFLERPISGKVDEIELKGVMDLVIAQGWATPKAPFFFLQELKKELEAKNDPVAQLLLAMLVVQSQSNSKEAMFGGYIVGRNWHFVILHNRSYAISEAYSATDKEEVVEITKILKALKVRIEEQLRK
ncbi:MAG: hypothetical protein AAF806_17320 [Bacteroidota bacterium]